MRGSARLILLSAATAALTLVPSSVQASDDPFGCATANPTCRGRINIDKATA